MCIFFLGILLKNFTNIYTALPSCKRNPEKKVEGDVVWPAVIIDDVLTTGNSIMQAINALRDEGFSVAGVVCVIDREEGEHLDELKKQMKVSTLFTHSDFKDFIDAELIKRKRQNQKVQSKL